MDAFPPLRRLCERARPMPTRLDDEPIRCKPLSSRCLPLSFGRSIIMASLVGVCGGEWPVSLACSTTTESMERGSMVVVIAKQLGTSEGRTQGNGEGSRWETTGEKNEWK